MNKLRIASIAGFVAALTSLISMYSWQWGVDLAGDFYVLSVLLMAVGALANVAYWYGFSLVGKRYKNTMLYYVALVALVLSVFTDASGALYTLAPSYAASYGWDMLGLLMKTIYGLSFILAGLAVQKLREQFGDTTLWYAVFSILSGILMLIGDVGSWIVTMIGMTLNIVLYILGGMILLQAAKK